MMKSAWIDTGGNGYPLLGGSGGFGRNRHRVEPKRGDGGRELPRAPRPEGVSLVLNGSGGATAA